MLFILLSALITGPFSPAQQIRFGGQIRVVSPAVNPVTYVPTATKFTNVTYLVHAGDLTGISDGGIFTGNLWFKLSDASQNATTRRMAEFSGLGLAAAGTLRVTIDTLDKLRVTGQNSAGVTVLMLKSTTSFTASTNWHCAQFSFDMSDASKVWLYIDDLNELNISTFTVGSTIDLANGGNFGIMARGTDGDAVINGSLSEVWGDTSLLDLSVSANRQLFRTPAGHPMNLGTTGQSITGSTPRLYLKNPFSTFQNNVGTGGNFSVTGSLLDDPNTP